MQCDVTCLGLMMFPDVGLQESNFIVSYHNTHQIQCQRKTQ